MTEENKTQCACGKEYSHTITLNRKTTRMCCECYVKAGYPPADWHKDCMETVKVLIKKND